MAITTVNSTYDTIGTAGSQQTTSNVFMGKDDFLKILISQIKHQDPLEPLKPEEFTGQLSQLTQVEQLLNIAGTLNKINDGQSVMTSTMVISQLLGAIGKKIRVDGDTLSMGDEVAINPAADFDRVVLTLTSVKDGSTSEVVLSKGDDMTYVNQKEFDVQVSAAAYKGDRGVDCSTVVYRVVRSVRTGEDGFVMIAGNGDRYSIHTVDEIRN